MIKNMNKLGVFAIAAVITLAIGIFIYEAAKSESTDDAYVETTTVQVSPKVSGQIIDVLVKDNRRVSENDFVAQIDPVDYRIKMQKANANFDVASSELTRRKNLYAEGAVSKQELDMAQAKFTELEAAKTQAILDYSRTTIQAPISGTVTNKRVEKGTYVQVGTPLFTIVPDQVWVVANFKENQIRKMKPGQPVDIKVDTYPDKVFKGEVDSIQRASGAKSSLFPPENAVGSFVKIVQRIPVKIIFTEEIDHDQYTVVPGMSVVPKVRVK
jgi:membrane fusion protein (multidrug efflux system)